MVEKMDSVIFIEVCINDAPKLYFWIYEAKKWKKMLLYYPLWKLHYWCTKIVFWIYVSKNGKMVFGLNLYENCTIDTLKSIFGWKKSGKRWSGTTHYENCIMNAQKPYFQVFAQKVLCHHSLWRSYYWCIKTIFFSICVEKLEKVFVYQL